VEHLTPAGMTRVGAGRKLSVSASAIVAFGLIAAAVMTESIQPAEHEAPGTTSVVTVSPSSPAVSPPSPTVSRTSTTSDGYPRATHESPPS